MSEKQRLQWRWRCLSSIIIAMGVSFLFLGVAMHFVIIPVVVEQSIRQNSQLLEGSRLMEKWKAPEYKIQFKVWVYSVKNPDEIMSGDMPEVVGTGPYTFDEKLENRVISNANGHVTFQRFTTYKFNENDSCETCILGNRVWVPNMIYQKFVEAASTSGMRAAATTLISQTAFLEVEVKELLFEGYKDPFLDKVCEIPFMDFVCDSVLDLPDRIGLFYEKNNTPSGMYEFLDGSKDPAELGKMVSWEGSPTLKKSWWSSDEARAIRGTDGTLFPPFIQKTDKLWVYVDQLCRSIWLEFESELEYQGVPAYKFIMPSEVLDTTLEENRGYCNPTEKRFFPSQNDSNPCWPKGLLDISQCQRSQPPIVISLPNFLFAADEVKESVKGMNETDKERDSIVVIIEPRTGVVLEARRRSQVNVEMWKGKDLTFPINLKKMRSSIVPILVVHEDVQIDETNLNLLKSELFNTEWWAYTLAKVLAVCGLILLLVGLLLTLIKMRRAKRPAHVVSPLPPYVARSSISKA